MAVSSKPEDRKVIGLRHFCYSAWRTDLPIALSSESDRYADDHAVRSPARARSSPRTHRPHERRHAVAKLIYTAITSLDGYIEDRDGTFDWAAPDEDVHQFVNDLERPVGTPWGA
jgi:hypothetical protein